MFQVKRLSQKSLTPQERILTSMENFALTVCYDGSRYRGWQKQGNTDNTIQGKLEKLLSDILKQDIELAGSGRTDGGVHARMQVCSFRADTSLSCDDMLAALRNRLPEDIGAVSLKVASQRFHARLNCREKTYCYRIWNSDEPNVFERKYMFSFSDKIDINEMKKAAALLLGEHDFTSFCSNKHMKKSAVRNLKSIDFTENGNELSIYLTADGFLYNMVRIIVGTLLKVGTGELKAEAISDMLSALDRSAAGPTAPAHGLTLWDIKY